MKVLVIGHPETVLGFSLVGVAGRAVTSGQEASAAMDDALENQEIGIVLVTKDVAGVIRAQMDRVKLRGTLPLVVEIPAPGGAPADEPSLSEVVLRAIGIRL